VFADALEGVLEDIFSGTGWPPVMEIAAAWATQIRPQPYSSRFSNSLLRSSKLIRHVVQHRVDFGAESFHRANGSNRN